MKLSGVSDLQRKLVKVMDDRKKNLDARLLSAAERVVSETRAGLSYDTPDEARNFTILQPGTQQIEIIWDWRLAAYWEFGTGDFAAKFVPSLSQWWQEYAKTFYINGLGTTPVHNVFIPAYDTTISRLGQEIRESKEYSFVTWN